MAQTKTDRDAIIAALPPDAKKIFVTDPSGKGCWKDVASVDTNIDTINLTSAGSPQIMRGKQGRPKKNAAAPAPRVPASIVQNASPDLKERIEFIEADPLVQEVSADPASDDVFHMLMTSLAQEATLIDYDRSTRRLNDDQHLQYTNTRARVLKLTAEAYLKKKSMTTTIIDIESPQFFALFGFLLETLKECMLQSGLASSQTESVFSLLSKDLERDQWKAEARRKMRDVMK